MSSQPMFNKVCIVGVGLIGGSIGLALKKRGLAKHVVGVVRNMDRGDRAVELGAIDERVVYMSIGIKDADLIILCTPVSTIIENINEISKYSKSVGPNTVIIDVGSTKSLIQKTADEKLKSITFIGCHPMAGSEKIGVENAREDLFEKSICFITKDNPTVKKFWESLGAKVDIFDAEAHDFWTAHSSHLPHIVSFALFQGFPITEITVPNPSIREFHRLAKSDPELWTDIIFSNKEEILEALSFFKDNIMAWEKALSQNKHMDIFKFIKDANGRTVNLLWKEPTKKSPKDDQKSS